MRRTRPWHIAVWALLALAAGGAALLGGRLGLLPWLRWAVAGVCAVFCALWVAMHLFTDPRRPRSSTGASFSDSGTAETAILSQTREAVVSYLSTVTHAGLLLRGAMYARPWFLVVGPAGAGKTALLERSGLTFPVCFPAEPVSAPEAPWERVRWRFANRGVWIDTPGALLETAAVDQWRALAKALLEVRPKPPVDGVLAVFDAAALLDADEAGVRAMAESVRRRLDDLIAAWAVEFPVYVVLTHADSMDGFAEFFGGLGAPGPDDMFGATLSAAQRAGPPREAVLEEFRTLAAALGERRIVRLAKEADDEDRCRACRFSIRFLSLEEKLGALAAELFRPSSYVGKPAPAGFYFTGSAPGASGQGAPSVAVVSSTVADHPLNPKRAASGSAPPAAGPGEQPMLFALPLLRMLMTEGGHGVRSTARRARARLIRAVAINAGAALVAAAVIAGLVSSRHRHAGLLAEAVQNARHAAAPAAAALEQRYRALGDLAGTVDALERRQGLVARLTGARPGPALEALRGALAVQLRQLIAVPAVVFLEREIRARAALPGELSAETYDELHRLLRTYLSVSEAGSAHVAELDMAASGAALREAVTRTLSAALGGGRLPPAVETVVNAAVPRYLTCLREQRCGFVQADQRMVQDARARLRRVPGAATLYQGLITRLGSSAQPLGLSELVDRAETEALSSEAAVSSLYTPEGWQRYVAPELARAASGQRAADWVAGETGPVAGVDTAGLAAGMLAAYAADVRDQWLLFLSSVKIRPGAGFAPNARLLRSLSSKGGELETLLRRVKELTAIDPLAGVSGALDSTAAQAQEAIGRRAPVAAAAARKAGGTLRRPRGPFAVVTDVFGPLAGFLEEGSGRSFTLAGYCERAAAVSQRLETLAQAPAERILAAFDGGPDDPLLAAWRYTRSGLGDLPPALSKALAGVLAGPLEQTGAEVSKALAGALNQRWNAEVVRAFAGGIAGRYPMSRRGQEASYAEVMDFFRPGAGVFWGFYDRMLSPYVANGPSGWSARNLGCVHLDFNPSLPASLTAAQRIRDMLFKPSGEPRTLMFVIYPPSRGRPAELDVCGLKAMLVAGGPPARVEWPMRAQVQGARLSVQLPDNSMREVSFDGEWGFMRLMQSGTVRPLNRSAFMVTWKVNVQNIYTIEQSYRVEVSGGDNPFGAPLFEAFECPAEIAVVKQPQPQ